MFRLSGNKLSETPQVETVLPKRRVHLLITLGIWHIVLHARHRTVSLCEFTETQIFIICIYQAVCYKIVFLSAVAH